MTDHNKILKFTEDNLAIVKSMLSQAETLLADLELSETERERVNSLVARIKTGEVDLKQAIKLANELKQ